MKHLLSIYDLHGTEIEDILAIAKDCQECYEMTGDFYLKPHPSLSFYPVGNEKKASHYNFVMGSLFFEPSTRTRLSFEVAHQKLGGTVVTVEDNSSLAKGETLEDSIKTISQMVDVIILRQSEKSILKDLTSKSDVPIINAGDGAGEHPTQALLDLYTIKQRFGSIVGKKVFFWGDTRYARTVNSLKAVLQHYKCEVRCLNRWVDVAQSNSGYINQLRELENNFIENLKWCDVLYVTRDQVERWGVKNQENWGVHQDERIKVKRLGAGYAITLDLQLSHHHLEMMHHDAIVMHPGPRNEEINPQIDTNPKVAIWEQVKNGVYVRMAILKKILKHV